MTFELISLYIFPEFSNSIEKNLNIFYKAYLLWEWFINIYIFIYLSIEPIEREEIQDI